ncbi:MAG: hypothetical protein IPJ19_14110 [Planctomycetes bacterium]|nr:hypothetical protein [Planctomycetota bacterium]
MEITPDGTRGFVARGATISVVDLTQTPPVEIDSHSVPDCQPLALRYYAAPGQSPRSLFVAGGALGVWRLSLCSNLFNVATPSACQPSTYAPILVQAPIEFPNTFLRKRCVDVEVLASHSPPILFALFASSSKHTNPTEVNELRAYNLGVEPPALLAACTFTSGTTTDDTEELATSLAVDPADSDSIYVGLGKGGIYRADLASTGGGGWNLTPSASPVWSPADCVGVWGAGEPEHVRDLAIVSVPTTPAVSVLYAALNYSEVLEITDLGPNQSCARTKLQDAAGTNAGFVEQLAVNVLAGPGHASPCSPTRCPGRMTTRSVPTT